ncbi:MAG: hypothetical protein D6798_01380, partial [Deltaproteobacteria bacterium]
TMTLSSLILLSVLTTGCDAAPDRPTVAPIPAAAPEPHEARPDHRSGRSRRPAPEGADAGRGPRTATASVAAGGDKAPLYVLFFTHHYRGMGGYYPTASEVRGVAEACVEQDMAPYCTLFFDGLLVKRLQQEDPELPAYVREHGFPIGYHGEEAHGPYPVVVSVAQMGQRSRATPQVEQPSWTFAQAVDALRARYTHDFADPRWGSDGYLLRASGGDNVPDREGGIALVEHWFDREASMMPGHLLFQPAAAFAFDVGKEPITLYQGAGPFAPHFLKNTRNPELIRRTQDYLGPDTNLIWFMGRPVEKGRIETQIPMWTTQGFHMPENRGGGMGPGGAGIRGGADGPPPGRFRRGAGDGFPAGAVPRSNPAARSRGRSVGLAPGQEAKEVFLSLDRSHPQLVQVKIDGSKERTSEALAWYKAQRDADPTIVFVNADTLVDHLQPRDVELSATAVATVLQSSWTSAPPDYLEVEGIPVSLADGFEVMARHLAGAGERVSTTGVIGPVGQASDLVTATGTVTADAIRAAAPGVVAAIDRSQWHAMPTTVDVGGTRVGFHQYAWLMAAVIAGKAGEQVELPAVDYSPPYARYLGTLLASNPPDLNFRMQAQFWTVKPVRWR